MKIDNNEIVLNIGGIIFEFFLEVSKIENVLAGCTKRKKSCERR
jgi:hypothetical protein